MSISSDFLYVKRTAIHGHLNSRIFGVSGSRQTSDGRTDVKVAQARCAHNNCVHRTCAKIFLEDILPHIQRPSLFRGYLICSFR